MGALPRGTVIVLDDYHLLKVNFQQSVLSYLLRAPRATVRLDAASREEAVDRARGLGLPP